MASRQPYAAYRRSRSILAGGDYGSITRRGEKVTREALSKWGLITQVSPSIAGGSTFRHPEGA